MTWQVDEARKEMGFSKRKLAKEMETSEAALYGLLDPRNTSVTLRTINNVTNILGKRMRIMLEDEPRARA